MKKSIKLLALALAICLPAIMTSCKSDDDTPALPKVGMAATHVSIATDPIDLYVQISEPAASAITVPFHCSGDATEGTDYTLSAKQFVIAAGETAGKITLSRPEKNIGDNNKTLTVNLDNGTGYELNLNNYTQVTLLGKSGYIVSFMNTNAKLAEEDEFSFEIFDMKGDEYSSETSETFQIEVDPYLSTAVEGEHFSFPAGKTVTVGAKKNQGTFKIKILKAEADKDIVVVRIADKPGFAAGPNPTMEIKLAGLENFSGTWAFKEFVNIDLFQLYGENMSLAPTATSAEQIILSGDTPGGYTFEPKFTGSFKKYFGEGSRKITYAGQVAKLFQDSYPYQWPKLAIFDIPDINIKFSDKQSSIRTAKVGFRLIEVDNKEVLEVTIDDYEPLEDEFGGNCWQFMNGMEGLTGGEWMPFRLHFSRVK